MFNGRLSAARSRLLAYADQHSPTISAILRSNANRHWVAASLDTSGHITYAKRPEHRWDTHKRITTSLGRYLSRRCGVNLDHDREYEITKIVGNLKADDESAIAVRTDVTYVYERGPHSCMKKNPNSCLDFYERNEIPILVYTSSLPGTRYKSIDARALLWTLDDGSRYLDRIYGSGAPAIALQRWAERRGIPHYREGPPDDATVTVDDDGRRPYMDTFSCWDGECLSEHGGCATWQDEHGGAGGYDCDECGDTYDSESEGGYVQGQYVCDSCYNGASYCENCDESTFSEVSRVHDGLDEHYWCQSCIDNYAHVCQDCTDHYGHSETMTPIDGDSDCLVCPTCLHEGEYAVCDSCHDWTSTAYVEKVDSETWCEHCASGLSTCDCCDKPSQRLESHPGDGREYCADCYVDPTPDLPFDAETSDVGALTT